MPQRPHLMFDTLSDRLDGVFKKLRSRGKLHPKQVDNALAEIRTALLEADVVRGGRRRPARPCPRPGAVRGGPEEPHARPAGREGRWTRSSPSRSGASTTRSRCPVRTPAVIMLAGVQGSGKTTACAKLAKHLKGKGRRPLLVAADLERPGRRRAAANARSRDRRARVVGGPRPREAREERGEGGAAHRRRRRDHRHRRASARRPRDDEAGPQDQGRHEARSTW